MPRSHKKLARKNRRLPDPSVLVTAATTAITGIAISTPTTTALVTFAGVMNCSGIAPRTTISGATVTGATQVSPQVIRLATNAAASMTGATYTVPPNDPAFRSPAGGWATAKTGTL